MKPVREEEFLQSLGAPCSLAETTAFETTQPALERLLVLVTLKSLLSVFRRFLIQIQYNLNALSMIIRTLHFLQLQHKRSYKVPQANHSTTVETTFSGEGGFTTTATPQLDTTTSFSEQVRQAGNNTISSVAIALTSILFLLVVGLAVALPIHFTRRLNAIRANAMIRGEDFSMTTNGVYELNTAFVGVVDQGDYI